MARFFLLLALLLQAGAAQAEPLDWLTGRWNGQGTALGNQSEATLEATPALAGKFIELRYRFHPLANPQAAFEGRALYRPSEDGTWSARWFDSRGVTFPIQAVLAGETLTAEWGEEGSERGRTVYQGLDDGRLEIVDLVRRADGEYREFARHILSPVARTKIDADPSDDGGDGTPSEVRSAAIEDASWLTGRWVGEGLGGEVEESWSAAHGSQMVGHFLLAKDGQPAFYEIMLLDEHEGGLRLRVKHFNPDFVAWEDRGEWHSFEPLSVSPGDLRFKGLRLTREGDGLVITVTLRDGDGPPRDHVLRLRRAPS